MYQIEYKVYHESLKNRDGRTGTSTQALPMHPGDLKTIFAWLDSPHAAKELGELRVLYFKAFATTAFTLWTRYVVEIISFICHPSKTRTGTTS